MKKYKSIHLSLLQKIFNSALHTEDGNIVIKNRMHSSGRRRFIKNISSAGLGIGLMSKFHSCSIPTQKNIEVAVIGAGLAGLTAGHYLNKASIKFTLFEGSNRCGGRIFTAQQDKSGLYFEMGGEFIDSDHNELLSLAKHYDLDLIDCQLNNLEEKLHQELFYFNGMIIENKQLFDEIKKYTVELSNDIKAIENNDEERIKYLDSISITSYLKEIGIKNWLFTVIEKCYTSEMGIEASLQSSLNFLNMFIFYDEFRIYGESDERYKIRGGNSSLIKKMENDLKSSIKFGSRLIEIKEEEGLQSLIFDNGQVQKFKYVIIAIPFSVLRKIKLPSSWPKEKLVAIHELGMGTNSKLHLCFNKRPWVKAGYSGYLFNEVIQNGWESTLSQNTTDTVFTIFLGGDDGKQLNTNMDKVYVQKMDEVFPGSTSAYRNETYHYNWISSHYAYGSYSVYKVGQFTTINGLEATPVGNIYFAGEHCSDEFQGYMNGAAETGKKAAIEIMQRMMS